MKTKAVILLSGGLDSTTVLYYALSKGLECHCIIFDYNQRHRKEINIAKKIATAAKAKFKVIKLDLNWNKTSLIGKDKKIPNHKTIKKGYIPTTYVPGRNTIFLSNALAYAETIKAKYIFLGINAVDYSSYPDCTPQYLKAMQHVFKALNNGIEIVAPIEHFSKKEIIQLGLKLNVPYKYTWSCYSGTKKPCGKCDSCKLRAKGFAEVGINDPALR